MFGRHLLHAGSIPLNFEDDLKENQSLSDDQRKVFQLHHFGLLETLQNAVGKARYKTLKFYHDLYLNENQLKDSRQSFFTKLKSREMSKEDSNTRQDSGAFIAIERTFSFEPEVAKNPLEFEALREKEQKGISDAIYETISSEASSSDDEDEQMQASRERVRKCIDLKWMKSLDSMNFNKNSVVQFLGSLILFSIHLPSGVKNGGLRFSYECQIAK